MTILKIGGSILEPSPAPSLIAGLAARRASGESLILVHGGGKALTALCARLGLAAEFRQGLRVTDAPTLQAAVMALAGEVNTRLVGALAAAGIPAVGLTGLAAASVRAHIADPTLGAVGEITATGPTLWRTLLAAGFLPVLASLALADDGTPLNVNADQFAASVAATFPAHRLEFRTDVPGILDANGVPLPQASLADLDALTASGAISAGMLPKSAACRAALAAGVAHVTVGTTRITL